MCDDDCLRVWLMFEFVCVIEGGGVCEANCVGVSGMASGTASGAVATSEEIGYIYVILCV